MIYLTGAALTLPTVQAAARASDGHLGAMVTPRTRLTLANLSAYPVWAADNGCAFQGGAFRLDPYLDWLAGMAPLSHRCLFAVAPDVVGDHAASWERSAPVLPAIRALGYRAAFVAQRGASADTLPWPAFDVLFIGDTDANRNRDATWAMVAAARRRGMWTHLGRCNSRRALLAAKAHGCQSADGTRLAFKPDQNLADLLRWLAVARAQSVLPLEGLPR